MRPLVPLVAFVCASALGCGEEAAPGDPGSGGSLAGGSAGTGALAGAGASSGGAASGAGGTTSGAGGAAGASGSATGGSAGASGATGGGAGTAGNGAAGTGGAGAGGSAGSAGGGGGSGDGAGGMPGGAGGASGNAGVSGSGGGTAECTRELLSNTTDAYFTALEARDPSSLPLAGSVKFTENGEEMALGEGGLWETAGALVYKHTAIDVDECSAMSQAVVPDGGMEIPVALRLKLVTGEITEIETIAVRPGDYSLGGSDTDALAASGDSVGWEETVPEGDRNTREEIIAWMDKYFRMFPAGVCDVTSACRRIENGGGNFMCTAGANCSPDDPGPGDNELEPRLILADVERGIGIGFTMFQGNTDMHMFKMYGDQVHGVSAVLGQAGSSGWD